ncbi:MAG: aminotransferase class I/II-fold pyridoxal phosphate-dependent enzyme [Gammaproteobacteria bacterium]|nr:aminotransferase class I/II-fold pyridoxal phosphate-dependent enzyme [Gammaproteobacteria bacterium]
MKSVIDKIEYKHGAEDLEMSSITKIKKCRICGNTNLVEVLDLGDMVLSGRFLKTGEPDPTCGPLKLVLCHGSEGDDHCGLLQLQHSYNLNEMYGETYGYRSSLSGAMVQHLNEVVNNALSLAKPLKGDAILDIGCNDGTLLGCYKNMGLERYGIDPSSEKFKNEFPEDIHLLIDFFSKDSITKAFGDIKFKIITSIAMFYDLDDPMSFMRDIHDALDVDGIWVTEQSHMATMLDNLAFDTVCHEHLDYYNLKQIKWMAERCDLKILDVEVNTINGASFKVVMARSDSSFPINKDNIDNILEQEETAGFSTLAPYQMFAERIKLFRKKVQCFFDNAKEAGETVIGYGASTKGNVILQYCDITPDDMPSIAEKYELKFGLVTPGSHIPIISEDEARAQKPDYLFVLPWHFRDAIIERESEYLNNGGALVFSLPRFEIVRKNNLASLPHHKSNKTTKYIPWAKPMIFGDENYLVQKALRSTFISDGKYVEQFESDFAAVHGMPKECSITTSNGTTALQMALLGLEIGTGDEVIVPGWAFAAAANMVIACGATPVFVDVNENTWLLNPDKVNECISSKTKAIIVVHTFGNVCDMTRLREISDKHGIVLIEDCAESLFSKINGKLSGTLGDIACYSFQATKTITCGEGGLVLSRDIKLAERMRLIRNHGMTPDRKYWHHVVGYNFRITNLQAAILCAQLSHKEEIISMRKRIFQEYKERLDNIKGLSLQKFNLEIDPVPWAIGVHISPSVYSIDRDEIMHRLQKEGIETRPGFYAMSQQPIYSAPVLEYSEKIAREVILLPMPPDITSDSIDHVCKNFLSALN